MSTSPPLSTARRVDSSGIDRNTRRLTLGVLRQYCSKASKTNSTPGVNETNLYGPAPTGAFLNPSSPTFSTYFLGTIQPAPVAFEYTVRKSAQGCLRRKRTRDGEGISTAATRSLSALP